jgi:hypothetical protein
VAKEAGAIVAILMAVGLLCVGIVGLVVIGFLPTWFVIMGDWAAFVYWYPIAITISQILGVLGLIAYPILAIVAGKPEYIIVWPLLLVMVVWGYPLVLSTGIALATQELTGITLQHTLLQFLEVNFLSLAISISTASAGKKEITIKQKK